jgi:UV DNA damage repair endonuclease
MFQPQGYPQYAKVLETCDEIANLIRENDMRICITPTLWQTLCGTNEESVSKGIEVLKGSAMILDLLGLPQSFQAPIIISLTTNRKGAKEKYRRFANIHAKLPPNVKSRLVVRNDQKFTRFMVSDLAEDLQETLEIPVVVDTLFHQLNSDTSTIEEALQSAFKTWGEITPLYYYSEMKNKVEWFDPKKPVENFERSYLVYGEPPFAENFVDCIIRAFGHEKAAIHMRNKHWRKNGSI